MTVQGFASKEKEIVEVISLVLVVCVGEKGKRESVKGPRFAGVRLK